MKPISLKFQAFGPYRECQFIDFSLFENTGLFLICGETGAGKTIILDAITYALYGKSSGGGRGDIYSIRCQSAPDSIATEVEYIFELKGQKYKFTRTLKKARKNMNVTQNAMFMDENGVFVPFEENPTATKIENWAAQLLGLSYEQFRQVILLPQGQFEKLLTSKSEEKEEILSTLFGVNKWQKAADIIASYVNEQAKAVEELGFNIERRLEDAGCEDEESAELLIKTKTEQTAELTEKVTALTAEIKKEREELQKKTILHESFLELDELKKEEILLLGQKSDMDKIIEKLRLSDDAELILPFFEKLKGATSELKNRTAVSDRFSKELRCAEEARMAAEKALAEAVAQKEDNEKNKKYLLSLENMSTAYDEAEKLSEEYQILKATEKTAADKFEEKNNAAKLIEQKKLQAETKQAELFKQHLELFGSLMRNMSGRLSAELKEGIPCPVCGSTEHPSPAATEETAVTDEMLDEINKKIDKIRVVLKRYADESDSLKKELTNISETLSVAKINLEKCGALLSSARSSLAEGIPDKPSLERKISELKKQISDYDNLLVAAEKNLFDTEKNLATAIADAKSAENEKGSAEEIYNEAKELFNKTLTEKGFDSEDQFITCLLSADEKTSLTDKYSAYNISCETVHKNIKKLSDRLGDLQKPDIEKLSLALNEKEEIYTALVSEINLLKNDTESLKNMLEAVKADMKKHNSAIADLSENRLFMKRIRGDTGISLQRYVLGAMLAGVTNEANRLLQKVHNGRYRLQCSTEKVGNSRKSGLELEVFDSFSGQTRNTLTLSGGEKFLVSLSLSIGLSSVVQARAGGIRLDSMFIDEGFGSLDPASVNDALDVLSVIKNTNGIVGIISHVGALKESITTRIEVEKSRGGSRIKTVI